MGNNEMKKVTLKLPGQCKYCGGQLFKGHDWTCCICVNCSKTVPYEVDKTEEWHEDCKMTPEQIEELLRYLKIIAGSLEHIAALRQKEMERG